MFGSVTENFTEEIPLYQKLFYLKKQSLSGDIFNESIPDELSELFELSSPIQRSVLVYPELIVKGKNEYTSYTFLNKERLRTRKDGEFYYEGYLESVGPQPVYITFITPENKFLSLKRTCIRLISPPDFKEVKDNRKTIIYFYNSRFFYDKDGNKHLNKALTRADLAYFIYQFLNQGSYSRNASHFKDVKDDKWYSDAVNFCAEYGYMTGYADDYFYPANHVSVLEYILAMSKLVLQKEPEKEVVFDTIDASHWIVPYLNTLLAHHLIDSNSSLNLYSDLNLISFINGVTQLPLVSAELDALDQTSEAEIHDSLDLDMIEFIYSFITQREELMENLKGLSFDHLKDGQFVFQEELTVSGIIFPIESFTINGAKIEPDIQGQFLATVNLDVGESVITVNALGEETLYHVNRLAGYSNLNDHWFSKTAAQLRYLSLLPDQDIFNSEEAMSRQELAHYIHRIYDVSVIATQNNDSQLASDNIHAEESTLSINNDSVSTLNLTDVMDDSLYKTDIQFLIEKANVQIEEGDFYPNSTVGRAEAVDYIVKVFYPELIEPLSVELPYWDVQDNYWAYSSIVKAYKEQLISPSPHFYPDKPITKAEFLTIISRVQKMKELFRMTFHYD